MRLRLHRPVLLATAFSLIAAPAAAEYSFAGDHRGEAGPGLDIALLEVALEPHQLQVVVDVPRANDGSERMLSSAFDVDGDGEADVTAHITLPSGATDVVGVTADCDPTASVVPDQVRLWLSADCFDAMPTQLWAQAWTSEAGSSTPVDFTPGTVDIAWMGPLLPNDDEDDANVRVTTAGPWVGALESTDRAWDATVRGEDRTTFDPANVDVRRARLDYDEKAIRLSIAVAELDASVPIQFSASLDTDLDGWTDVPVAVSPSGRISVIHVERDGQTMTGQRPVECPEAASDIDVDAGTLALVVPVGCLPDEAGSMAVKVSVATAGEDGAPVWSDVLPSGVNSYLGPVSPRPRPTPQARTTERSCPEGEVPAGQHDDTDRTVHRRAIDCVSWWGIAGGTGGASYSPERTVTRAQMATFIAKALDRTEGGLAAGSDGFSDDDGNPHEDNIDRLAAAGIIRGSGDGTFGPGRPVSRAQMATFIVNAAEHALGRELTSDGDVFDDDDGNPHEGAIDVLASVGVTGGSGDGYGPGQLVRRDQMASFLARLMDLLVEEGVSTTP